MTEELALSIAPDSFKRYKDLAGLDDALVAWLLNGCRFQPNGFTA